MIINIIIISAWLIGIVLGWKRVSHILALTILFLPAYQIRFSFFDIPFTLLEASIFVLCARWIIEKKLAGIRNFYHEYICEHEKLFLYIILFIFASIISIFISPNLLSALGIFKAYIIEPIIFFIIFIDIARTKNELRLVVGSLASIALFIGAYSIFQAIKILPTPELWLSQDRFTSVFSYPNAVGLFLAPIIPIIVGASKSLFTKKESVFLMFIAFVSIIAIILAKTEAAIAALICAIIIWGLFKGRRWRIASIIAIFACFAIIYSVIPIQEKILLKDWSGTVRRLMWHDTSVMLANNPIFGVGLSGYPTIFKFFHRHPDIEIFQYPHNIILNFWSETGLLGLIAFLAIIQYFLFTLLKDKELRLSYFYQSVAISIIVIIIHGLVDVPFFKNDLSVLFWLIVGIMIANPQIASLKKNKKI